MLGHTNLRKNWVGTINGRQIGFPVIPRRIKEQDYSDFLTNFLSEVLLDDLPLNI